MGQLLCPRDPDELGANRYPTARQMIQRQPDLIELEAYEASLDPTLGPSLAQYSLQLNSTIQTSWNQRALDLWIPHWLGPGNHTYDERDQAASLFLNIFSTLRKEYRNSMKRENGPIPAPEALRVEKILCAQAGRRRLVGIKSVNSTLQSY